MTYSDSQPERPELIGGFRALGRIPLDHIPGSTGPRLFRPCTIPPADGDWAEMRPRSTLPTTAARLCVVRYRAQCGHYVATRSYRVSARSVQARRQSRT